LDFLSPAGVVARLFVGMDTAIGPPLPVDLYRLRCAVAALVVCVGHEGLLDAAGYRRTEIAVRVLSAAPLSPTSAIRRAIDRLVSPDEDPNGSRTRGAIAELAGLTHVDTASAADLAAELLPTLPRPHQGALFDGNAPADPGGGRAEPIDRCDLGSGEEGPA
jgi:hypothetical protein